jgi:hypothetical protein
MPILGTIASSLRGAAGGAYESIATILPTGSTYGLSFTSIPSTYEHLQVRAFFRETSGTTGNSEWYLRFNGNTTGANYWKYRWYANGTSYTGSAGAVSSEGIWGTPSVRNGATDKWGCFIIDIHDYAGSTNKSARVFGMGWNDTNTISLGNAAGPFTSTSAISSIEIGGNQGNFASGSVFALYGIKGSA